MDHIVYTDTKAGELENLIAGIKTMVIRGATGRKMPYGRVNPGDTLYFINNNGEGAVRAKANVLSVMNSQKMDRETSEALVNAHQIQLKLTPAQVKRWAGKRYLVLVEISECLAIEPFAIDKSNFGNMDDWLPVGNIEQARTS